MDLSVDLHNKNSYYDALAVNQNYMTACTNDNHCYQYTYAMALMDVRKVEYAVIKMMIVYDRSTFGYIKCREFTPIAGDIPADSCLYSKAAHTIIRWYISTSDIGVVGGSGAAATV